MNGYVAAWIAVEVAVMLVAWRGGAIGSSPRRYLAVVLPAQLLALAAALGSVVSDEPVRAMLVWLSLTSANVALAVVGVAGGAAALASVGLAGAAVALTLIALHAFLSLPVMAASGVLCAGAALLGAVRGRASRRFAA